MLATVSPCAGHLEETLSTLRYACQVRFTLFFSLVSFFSYCLTCSIGLYQKARKIINTARICEDANTRHIRHLREQIKLLENRLLGANVQPDAIVATQASESSSRVGQLESEIFSLKTRLKEVESQKDVSWQDKVTQAEIKRAEAEEALANYGLSNNERDPFQPCLVNVNQVKI